MEELLADCRISKEKDRVKVKVRARVQARVTDSYYERMPHDVG